VQPSLEELAKDPIMKELQGELAAVSAATKALALRWIRMARDVMEAKFKHRSDNFREDVDTLLGTPAHTYIHTYIHTDKNKMKCVVVVSPSFDSLLHNVCMYE
jgi:hypothetical protein